MNVLINHCWCSDSIWGGHYDCSVIVTLNMVQEGKNYHDEHDPDWTALLDEVPFKSKKEPFRFDTRRLKPEVAAWLEANVKDRKVCSYTDGGVKAWAVGTDAYNAANTISFSLFFERRRDAMAFIKRWSAHKQPIHYLNYFTDVRKELDPATGTLKRAKR